MEFFKTITNRIKIPRGNKKEILKVAGARNKLQDYQNVKIKTDPNDQR